MSSNLWSLKWTYLLFMGLLFLPVFWIVFHLGHLTQTQNSWRVSGHLIQNQNWDGYHQEVSVFSERSLLQKMNTTVSGLFAFQISGPGNYQIWHNQKLIKNIQITKQTPQKIYLGQFHWGEFRSYRPVISLIILFSTLFYVLLSFLLFSRLKDKKLGFIFLLMSLPPFWVNLIDATQDLLAYFHFENLAASLFHIKYAFLILTAGAFPLLFLYFPKPQFDFLKKTQHGFLFFIPGIPLAIFYFISALVTEDYFFKQWIGFSYALLIKGTMLYLLVGVILGYGFLLMQTKQASTQELKKRLFKMSQVMIVFLGGLIIFVIWPVVFRDSQPYFAYQYPLFNAVSTLILFLSWAYFIFQGKMAPIIFKIDPRLLSKILSFIYGLIYFALVLSLSHYFANQNYFSNQNFFVIFLGVSILSFGPGRRGIQKIFDLIFITPDVKYTEAASQISQALLQLKTPQEIESLLKKEFKKIYPGLKFYLETNGVSSSKKLLKNYNAFELPFDSIKGKWILYFSHDYAAPTSSDWAFFNLIKDNLSIALLNAKLYQNLLNAYKKQKGLQSTIRQQETLAAVGEMSATLAHEIKNPMTGISTFVQLFESQHQDSDYIERFKKTMPAQVTRINETLQKLLHFAKAPQIIIKKQNVVEGVLSQIELLRKPSVEMTYAGPQKLLVDIDLNLMQEIVANLILNAMEAKASKIHFEMTDHLKEWQLKISDNGPGISKTMQKKIFQPFFSTKTYGTGLGLATVQKNVQVLNGRIEIKSSSAKGTLFILRFHKASF